MKCRFSRIGFFILALLTISAALSFAEDIYESRLDEGLRNTEPYAYTLIKKAQNDPLKAKGLLSEAIKYSPNLPAAYFEMSKASFSASPDGIFRSLNYAIEGLKAYKRNFWWLMSITGLSFVSLTAAGVIALLFVICIRFFIDAPLLSHDITENKKKTLLILPLILLSLMGPLFFIAGALFLLGLYFRKIDKAVVYAAALLLLTSPFIVSITNIFISAPSPELRAIVAVNEGRDNKYAISVLKGKNDFASLFSYGLALKRERLYEEAITAYKKLLSPSPTAQVYVNLGNCYFSINDMTGAKDLYKKAVEIKPMAAAYYNLSQVSRETLDFAKVEEYFLEAARLNKDIASGLVSASKNPNRFIVDETLPMHTLLEYASSKTQNVASISFLNTAVTSVIAALIIILFPIIGNRVRHKAYRCKRCGSILCGKCGKEILWGQMCSLCYRSLVKFDELDSRVRVAKLLEVQELQSSRRNIAKILSFTLPGVAHIYSGRILVGSLFLWLFLFLLFLMLLNPAFPAGLSLFSHSWLAAPALLLMAAVYLISNISIRRKINREWL